ncbi:hypothetical protein EKD00_05855 [Chlorobium phaeovibrioides]|uniref:Lipoprotein n=1 Tax=Chlorobium phaeovibrioides TaxID=1094 RepID=A0A3S0MQV7_CHLPH|nr:hypothetical protein [Chlorobium phaeovibrioides]KAA6232916.1 hypothetical protein FP507_07545 [Chlorobium phaeovibrioides]MWV54844.1 hypothetical protein [Chlorobium phaeovibrioides]QEQ56681.1 hypothetical protein FNV82_02840 [Chlorobium phaeovibrioides]RTY35331.1 hypothetical protein EKD00_05855 [Chlorobium phaeovibrioides]RTY38878.1 hypothetical protein EKD02_04180 [Chlorobium phaeovibrioides]
MKKVLAVSLLLLATGCTPYLRNHNDDRRDEGKSDRYEKKESWDSDRKDRKDKDEQRYDDERTDGDPYR